MIATYEFWAYGVLGRFDGERIRVYGRDESYWAEHPKLGHCNAPSPDDAVRELLSGWHWQSCEWFNWSAVA